MEKETSVGSLTLKKYHIYSGSFTREAPIMKILDVPLHGQQARSRNRIIKIIKERSAEIEDSRLELIKKFGKKDEKNELIVDPKTNSYVLENEADFDKEYKVIMQEEVVFDLLPSNKADFKVVKGLVLECKVDFDIPASETYSEICEAFEKF